MSEKNKHDYHGHISQVEEIIILGKIVQIVSEKHCAKYLIDAKVSPSRKKKKIQILGT